MSQVSFRSSRSYRVRSRTRRMPWRLTILPMLMLASATLCTAQVPEHVVTEHLVQEGIERTLERPSTGGEHGRFAVNFEISWKADSFGYRGENGSSVSLDLSLLAHSHDDDTSRWAEGNGFLFGPTVSYSKNTYNDDGASMSEYHLGIEMGFDTQTSIRWRFRLGASLLDISGGEWSSDDAIGIFCELGVMFRLSRRLYASIGLGGLSSVFGGFEDPNQYADDSGIYGKLGIGLTLF